MLLFFACSDAPPPEPPRAPPAPTAAPPEPWLEYHGGGVSFSYPEGATVEDTADEMTPQRQVALCAPWRALVCVVLDREELGAAAPALVAAEVAVGWYPDADAARCLAEESNLHLIGERQIGDVTFARFSDSDGVNVLYARGEQYLAFRDGKCWFIGHRTTYSGEYDPVPPEVRARIERELDAIVDSVRFE